MQWSPRVDRSIPLDANWLRAHPLPRHAHDIDKNARGRVLVVGGSRNVPGGVLLTAEAAFRAGAGKVTIATIASLAVPLGLAMPECGIVPLAEADGQIIDGADMVADLAAQHDAIVIGPAMDDAEAADTLLAALLPMLSPAKPLLLDAAALRAASRYGSALCARDGNTILTPHEGEMAALVGEDRAAVAADRDRAVEIAANRFGATVMMKGQTSLLRHGYVQLAYAGGGIGLATGGSGDVLAGLVSALAARGMEPLHATAWGIWLHGEAGRRLAETVGPLGYLARELLPLIPGLMRGV